MSDIADRPLRLGTRGSPLALTQARMAAERIATARPVSPAPEIVTITTTGDQIQDRPLAEIGGKALFAKEIEIALLQGRIDAAVHSLKDMETTLPDGLAIGAVLPRGDPRDALVSRHADAIAGLPEGATVGTSSIRRTAQLRAQRPDLNIVPLRGNVGTRLRKLEDGAADAALLAMAGLSRLGLDLAVAHPIDAGDMLPAACQGMIAIEYRADDKELGAILAALSDSETHKTMEAERGLLAAIEGSCATPVAALARLDGATIALDALIAAPDGTQVERVFRSGPVTDAGAIGRDAGLELRARAPASAFGTV